MPKPKLYGIDELRQAVNLFANCREGFNQEWTPSELVAIARAHRASEYDVPPDKWTEAQVHAAIAGHAPRWTETDGEGLAPVDPPEAEPTESDTALVILSTGSKDPLAMRLAELVLQRHEARA